MNAAECRMIRDLAAEISWRERVAEQMAAVADLRCRPPAEGSARTPAKRMADAIAAGLELMPVEHQLEAAERIRLHVITQLGALTLPRPTLTTGSQP